jgi:hypothetical protein
MQGLVNQSPWCRLPLETAKNSCAVVAGSVGVVSTTVVGGVVVTGVVVVVALVVVNPL